MNDLYAEDLAYVHHTAFGDFATGAAPGLLRLLVGAGIRDGLVVDLGCGSGIWARELCGAGHGCLGIDASVEMLPSLVQSLQPLASCTPRCTTPRCPAAQP